MEPIIQHAQQDMDEKLEEQIRLLDEIARNAPTPEAEAIALGHKGDLLSEHDLVGRAILDYQRAAKLDKSPKWRRRVADSYFTLGLPRQAYRAYRKALELDPNDAESHFYMAEFLTVMGRTRWAIAEFQEAVQLAPDRAYYSLRLGEACLIMGRIDNAIEALAVAVKIEPDEPYYHFRLANAWACAGQLDKAVECLERAVSLAPCDDYYHALLAMAYGLKNEYRDSLRMLGRTVEIRPNNHAYRYLLAECYQQLGMHSLAQQHFRRAGELDEYDRDYVDRLRNKFLVGDEWRRPEWT